MGNCYINYLFHSREIGNPKIPIGLVPGVPGLRGTNGIGNCRFIPRPTWPEPV
jgi:hypothetical protein